MTAKILQFKRKEEAPLFTNDWIACGRCGYNGHAQHCDCGPDFEAVPMCECEMNAQQEELQKQKSIAFSLISIYNWFKLKY